MSEDIIQEIQNRMKELEALKTDLWNKGEYDPMMAEEYWDCQVVLKQMQEGDGADVSEFQKHKQESMIAAQQQIHRIAEES